MKLKAGLCLSLYCFVLCAMLSCNPNNSDLVVEPQIGRVAFFNLIPNGTPLDGGFLNLYINGTRQNTNKVGYDEYSGYMDIASGNLSVLFKTDSLRNDLFDPPRMATIPADSTTIFVTGKSADNLIFARDTVLPDPSTTNFKPKLRFINASADAPAFDMVINNDVTISNQAYKSISPINRVDTGKVILKLNLAGTSTNVITSQPITIQANRVYTLFVYGSYTLSGPTGLNLGIIANY